MASPDTPIRPAPRPGLEERKSPLRRAGPRLSHSWGEHFSADRIQITATVGEKAGSIVGQHVAPLFMACLSEGAALYATVGCHSPHSAQCANRRGAGIRPCTGGNRSVAVRKRGHGGSDEPRESHRIPGSGEWAYRRLDRACREAGQRGRLVVTRAETKTTSRAGGSPKARAMPMVAAPTAMASRTGSRISAT